MAMRFEVGDLVTVYFDGVGYPMLHEGDGVVRLMTEKERALEKAKRYHVNKLDELGRVYRVAIWNEQYRYMRKVERICGEGLGNGVE